MTKRKKNKALPLIVMAGVLVALIVGYTVLSSYNAKKAEEEANAEAETVEVLKKENAIPVNFSYTLEKDTLAFSYVDEKWVYLSDETFPVDSDAVTKMVAGLTDVKAVSKVNLDGADVDSFGLNKPSFAINVKYSDGSDCTFNFGIVNTYNGYQYMKTSAGDDIYLVEASLAEGLSKKLTAFYDEEIWTLQNDAATAEDVTSVVIETADGKTNKIEDKDGMEKLFNLIYKLNLSDWEDHYADENEMKEKYGIYPECDRVTLNYTKATTITKDDGTKTTADIPTSYTVYFGYEFEVEGESETTAEGDEHKPEMKFFYTQKGSKVVYSKDKDVADDIFEYITYTAPKETEVETAE